MCLRYVAPSTGAVAVPGVELVLTTPGVHALWETHLRGYRRAGRLHGFRHRSQHPAVIRVTIFLANVTSATSKPRHVHANSRQVSGRLCLVSGSPVRPPSAFARRSARRCAVSGSRGVELCRGAPDSAFCVRQLPRPPRASPRRASSAVPCFVAVSWVGDLALHLTSWTTGLDIF